MLVLRRRQSESLRIHTSDGLIEIVIQSLDGNQVKLGFNAPESVAIYRSEIDPIAKRNFTPPVQQKINHPNQQTSNRGIASMLLRIGVWFRAR